jgi:hypothetical protein
MYPSSLAADLRAGSIDSGAALMIAEVALQVLAELPGGRERIAAALERKVAEFHAMPCQQSDAGASLLVMREIVREAVAA